MNKPFPIVTYKGLGWHDIRENTEDVPDSGLWFICKIKGSDDLKLVCGYENVSNNHYDSWAKVECPF